MLPERGRFTRGEISTTSLRALAPEKRTKRGTRRMPLLEKRGQPGPCRAAASVRSGLLGLAGEVDGNQEAVGAAEIELLPVTLVVVPLALPHAEALIGLRAPVLQVVHHDLDRKSTRLNSSHIQKSRMPSSA